MYRVFTCLAAQHDYRLVLLALLICAATSFTAFTIYARAVQARSIKQLGWLALAGLCTASGIWATHFVIMLAYQPGVPIAYDPVMTAGSLLVAFVATTLGYLVGSHPSRIESAIGGAAIGIGIGLMHFTGMRALILPGTITWDPLLVTVSLICGAVLGSAAMVAFHRAADLRAIAAGASLLTLAICGLHFIAMGAIVVEPDPTASTQAGIANPAALALSIGVLTVLAMSSGLVAALIDRQARLESVTRIRDLVDAACEGLVIVRNGVIVNANRRACELFGRPAEALIGRRLAGDLLEQILPLAPRSGIFTLESSLKTAQGSMIPVEVVGRPLDAEAHGSVVYALRDLTDRRRTEVQIAYMAHHDALTDLPNRVLMRERMQQAIAPLGENASAAVLCLDLDRFKNVNDALGHSIGDALLKAVAERLRGCVREGDTVARLGGDEFAVLQIGAGQPFGARALATRLIEALSAPYHIDEHQIIIGASVGIALAAPGASDPDLPLKEADTALYRAKSEGRGIYRFFEAAMDEPMRARRLLEAEIRKGIIGNEFELYYQPIVDLERNAVAGFEALLRWRHPQRGLLCPADFMPVTEETGFIAPLGDWVLREACLEATKWPEHLKIAINLSPTQFRSANVLQSVFCAIAASGIAPSRIELEVTESALLQEREATLKTLRQLQNVGVRVALDDFGAGCSSLSYLRSFRFDKIKIDRSFVAALSNDSQQALAMVRAITQMGASLGLAMTAEGVETEEQLKSVRIEGCTEVQGYLFSPPRPAQELPDLFNVASPAAAFAA